MQSEGKYYIGLKLPIIPQKRLIDGNRLIIAVQSLNFPSFYVKTFHRERLEE